MGRTTAESGDSPRRSRTRFPALGHAIENHSGWSALESRNEGRPSEFATFAPKSGQRSRETTLAPEISAAAATVGERAKFAFGLDLGQMGATGLEPVTPTV